MSLSTENTTQRVVVSLIQAQAIIDDVLGQGNTIEAFMELPRTGFSTLTSVKSYDIRLVDSTTFVLKVSPPSSLSTSTYATNSISAENALLIKLSENSSIPHPKPRKLDTTLMLLPYPYLLLEYTQGISLAEARASGKLTTRQSLLIDLRLGAYLKEMHEHVQNDWFGLPSQEKDELYSWQEAFTWLLEDLLHEVESIGVELAYEDIRRYLSRAIGFFLFDDCEAPSLVSLVGDADSVILDFDPNSPPSEDDIRILTLFPLSHALWGDPMLEAWFLDPSDAFLEGYGGSPILFARQKTKRLWYTLFLALVVLVQAHRSEAQIKDEGKVSWAREALKMCWEKLKDSPCY